MYIAGLLADAGWEVYFPRRDRGFDMIVSCATTGGILVRPVQVRGKYATGSKTDKARYGYVGALTALHPDMVLALPFFTSSDAVAPRLVAWAPRSALRKAARGYAFEPASFVNGEPRMRRDFTRYFGGTGLMTLKNME